MSAENPEKRFVRNFLDATILSMIIDESLWGYRLMTLLKERYKVKVGPPVIYPLLDSMEKNGLITSWETKKSNRIRKMYDITDEGREYLKKFGAFLAELIKY